MAKKPGGTKALESAGEVKDVNATPCPKCQERDALTWYSQELGEQMRGCVKCKYQNTVDQWDALSLKQECEAIADEMEPQDLNSDKPVPGDDLEGMALHESRELFTAKGEVIIVVCVPGGWVYRFGHTTAWPIFVPDPQREINVNNHY